MKKLLIVLTLSVLAMFSVKKSLAKEASGLIVFAIDQSNSTFLNNDNTIIRKAIITALTNYVVDCNTVHVDYIAWGSHALPAVSADLVDQQAVLDFALELHERSKIKLGATVHQEAIASAVSIFEASHASKKLLVFITNGASAQDRNLDLGRTIPPDVKVYTISLGSLGVSDYVLKNIQPTSGGVHFHANNVEELVWSLEEAFAAAKNDLCLS